MLYTIEVGRLIKGLIINLNNQIPKELILTVTVSSKNKATGFKLSEKFTLPVSWGLRIDPSQKAIELDMHKRSQDVVIPTSSRLEVIIDEKIKTHVRTSYNEGDTFTVSFRVPDDSSDNQLEGRVKLIDPMSHQEDTIFYYFDPTKNNESNWDFDEFRPVDALVTGIVISLIFFLINQLFQQFYYSIISRKMILIQSGEIGWSE